MESHSLTVYHIDRGLCGNYNEYKSGCSLFYPICCRQMQRTGIPEMGSGIRFTHKFKEGLLAMIYTELTKKAMKICYAAHKNQTDESGVPYVFHPFHLAEYMDTEFETCAALLHDVPEDTDWTLKDLEEAGFPRDVTEAIFRLTHDRNVPYMEYVLHVRENEIARKVKMMDLTHNCDYTRLNTITSYDRKRHRKYRIAKGLLERKRIDSETGRKYRSLPLHDDNPWYLRIFYKEDGSVNEGLLFDGSKACFRMNADRDFLLSGVDYENGKSSLPEQISDYLYENDLMTLDRWFDQFGIPYEKIEKL